MWRWEPTATVSGPCAGVSGASKSQTFTTLAKLSTCAADGGSPAVAETLRATQA